MLKKIKHYILIGILLAIGYLLASQHIIIVDKDFKLLKKSYLSFEYTFYFLTDKNPEHVMRIDLLREAGIGDFMVEMEMLTDDEKEALERKYESETE
jgi:predicted membrane protein